MNLSTVIILYCLIGVGLSFDRLPDIAVEADDMRGDFLLRVLLAACKWILTWPLWVGR